METSSGPEGEMRTLSFSQFRDWLGAHDHCILRVGNDSSILFDHDDHHWILQRFEGTAWTVRAFRGKHLVGQIVLPTEDIQHVLVMPGDQEEWLFDLIALVDGGLVSVGYFALVHDYDADPALPDDSWVN